MERKCAGRLLGERWSGCEGHPRWRVFDGVEELARVCDQHLATYISDAGWTEVGVEDADQLPDDDGGRKPPMKKAVVRE